MGPMRSWSSTKAPSGHRPMTGNGPPPAGKLELVGKRALSERGNELGELDDVTFDADTGVLEDLLIGARRVDAGSVLGSGSYAVVLDESQEHSP